MTSLYYELGVDVTSIDERHNLDQGWNCQFETMNLDFVIRVIKFEKF